MRTKALIYYLLSMVIMAVYGGRVCPLIDTLPIWKWAVVMVVAYAVAYAVRLPLEKWCVESREAWRQGGAQFYFELFMGVGIGVAVSAFDWIYFEFPTESAFKVLVGTTCFAFFTALDMTLARERKVADEAEALGGAQPVEAPFHSLTRRLSILAACWAGFNTAIISMVVFKDIVYLQNTPPGSYTLHAGYVAGEISFVAIVLLAFTMRVLFSYASNLRRAFGMQTEVLEAVGRGDLDHSVPIVSSDEFGQIASQTNRMIEGLREKDRIRSVLGKMVAPGIADMLVRQSEEGLRLGGERCDLVIFMSDIRDFTTRSEQTLPEHVVRDLNAYFTACVEIIRDRGGMVDKFIGDGILAVFGLGRAGDASDMDEPPADAAVKAAMDIIDIMRSLNRQLDEPMRVGFGIHVGSVISGLVGSPDRMEFTVIGDAVNTAARIESLSKDMPSPLLVSDELRDQIQTPRLKEQFQPCGEHSLKGKSQTVKVWCLKAEN